MNSNDYKCSDYKYALNIMEEEKNNKFIAPEIRYSFKASIEALKKQIPEKVTHEASLHGSCTCPNCKNVIDKFEQIEGKKVRVEYKYCHFCGQRLEW